MFAAMAEGDSIVTGLGPGEDIISTIAALECLDARGLGIRKPRLPSAGDREEAVHREPLAPEAPVRRRLEHDEDPLSIPEAERGALGERLPGDPQRGTSRVRPSEALFDLEPGRTPVEV